MVFVDQALKFLVEHSVTIGTVLGILFFFVKRVSNKKADPVMAKIQEYSDKIPALVDKVGDILKAICTIISKALKSDGFLGKE